MQAVAIYPLTIDDALHMHVKVQNYVLEPKVHELE